MKTPWKSRLCRIVPLFLICWLAGVAWALPVLDGTFGTGGASRIGVPDGAQDSPQASVVQRDGKLLVAGWSSGRQSYSFVLRFDGNGRPDPTFGDGGRVSIDPARWWSSMQIEQGADGSIFVAAHHLGEFRLTRLMPNGVIDSRFASNGVYAAYSVATDHSPRFLLQADGGMLIVADATPDGPGGANLTLRLTRLTASGTPDTAFAPGGEKILGGLPANFRLRSSDAVVAQPDGGFTVLANANASFSGGSYLLLRISASGALDTAFGVGGIATGAALGRPFDVPVRLAIARDGGLLLLGEQRDDRSGSASDRILVWRVTSSGTLDRTFGVDGRIALSAGGGNAYYGSVLYNESFRLRALANGGFALLEGDGRFNGGPSVRRFDEHGVADDSFGQDGKATLALPGYDLRSIGLLQTASGALIVPAAASLRRYGGLLNVVQIADDVALFGLDASGRPQAGYGRGDGIATWNTPQYSYDTVHQLLVEPSGKLMLVGVSTVGATSTYLLMRFEGSGAADSSFGENGRVSVPEYTRCNNGTRAVEQAGGAVMLAAGVGVGSYCQLGNVATFRVGATGVKDEAFKPGLALPMDASTAVALGARADGRLLYSTVSYGQNGRRAVLQQILPDGQADPAFGTGGTLSLALPDDELPRQTDLRVLGDGSPVLAVLSDKNLRLRKFDVAGQPDTAFGSAGELVYPLAADGVTAGETLLVLPDGSFLVGLFGYQPDVAIVSSGSWLTIVRVSRQGQLSESVKLLNDASLSSISAWRLLAMPDGSVLIARNFAQRGELYRLLPDNRLDEEFGVGGVFAPPGLSNVDALALDAQGRLLLAGQDAISAFLARYDLHGTSSSAPVVEFYHPTLRHYFISAWPGEIADIDAGGAGGGWQRTGQQFRAYLPETGVPAGALPVCRFYGTPGRGPNSHFYTVSAQECALVKNDPGWTYEGIAFYLYAPDSGQCAAGQQLVSRSYNNRAAQNDSNHRYTGDPTLYAQMLAQGWSAEGGVFCAPTR